MKAALRARIRAAIPTQHLIIVTGLRLAIGVAALWSASLWFSPLGQVVKWGGTMFCFLSVYGLFGHLEGHAMNAIVRLIEVATTKAPERYPVYSSGLGGWWNEDNPPASIRPKT